MSMKPRPALTGTINLPAIAACLLVGLTGLMPAATVAASPLTLRQEVTRFISSSESAGLTFCALFVPVLAAPSDSSASVLIGGERPMIPASLAKLTTSSMALEQLGSGFTFKTRLLADGPVEKGTLRGDLVAVGGADPFLVSERLWLLADQLHKTGLNRVDGRLVIDGSLFAKGEDDPARTKDREISDRPYAARLSPLATNFNSAAILIAPGAAEGGAAEVSSDPIPCSYLRIDNHVVTGVKEAKESWTIHLEPDSLGEVARLEGVVPLGTAPQRVYRSVSDPERFAASLLRAFLAQAGIKIAGETIMGKASETAQPLMEFSSPRLGDLVASADRHSNNFMSDLIAMSLADSTAGPNAVSPATANLTLGAARVTRWLREELGADLEIRQVDGSGLSPANRLSGDVLLRLLLRDWRDLRVQPDLVAALAVPGEDGTLRKRFDDAPAPFLRAKTGTMGAPMASGIAGYLQDPARGSVAFVVLMNPAAGSSWEIPKLQALQEAWVREYVR
jgi:serine-type D-Ala-D-Ala carboxypeptidase/endopeptidase (penicillin-binding protein 4)